MTTPEDERIKLKLQNIRLKDEVSKITEGARDDARRAKDEDTRLRKRLVYAERDRDALADALEALLAWAKDGDDAQDWPDCIYAASAALKAAGRTP